MGSLYYTRPFEKRPSVGRTDLSAHITVNTSIYNGYVQI